MIIKERTLSFDEATNWKIEELKKRVKELNHYPDSYSNLNQELEKFSFIKAISEDFIEWIESGMAVKRFD